MARFPVPTLKNTIVAIDGVHGKILTTARGEHQALMPRAAADYDKYEDINGNPITGPVSLCDAILVDLCVADICAPCETMSVVVPDALLSEPAGTPIFATNWVEQASGVVPNAIPDLGLAGDVAIGTIASVEDCSVGYWDKLSKANDELPAGYSYLDIKLFPSALAAYDVATP